MNQSQIDNHLARWLAGGPRVAPERLAASAAAYAQAHPRDHRITIRSLLAGAGALVRPTPVALRPLLALILLGLTFALGAAFWAAWNHNTVLPVPSPTIQPSPSPVGCAGNPNDPGPVGQARPYVGQMTFDTGVGRIIAVENWQAAPPKVWTFDVCGNSWYDTGYELLSPPTVSVYRPSLDDVLLIGAYGADEYALPNDFRLLDMGTGVVTVLPQIPTGHLAIGGVYRSRTDQTVLLDEASALWTYDEDAGAWVALAQTGDVLPRDASFMGVTYDSSTDRLIVIAQGAYSRTGVSAWAARTYEYDFGSATWIRGEAVPVTADGYWSFAGRMAYDALHERSVLVSGHLVVGYDSTTHAWEELLAGEPGVELPLDTQSAVTVYDPINERVVAVCSDGAIWAFDLETQAWTSLLAPREP